MKNGKKKEARTGAAGPFTDAVEQWKQETGGTDKDYFEGPHMSAREFEGLHQGSWKPNGADERRTDIFEIRVDQLRAAPWNYKPAGTPEQMSKLVASIKRDGSAGVIAVRQITERRPAPFGDDLRCNNTRNPNDPRSFYKKHVVYEVIDGNHRLAAIQEAGWNTVFCEDFGQISLADAIVIARRRNEQWYDVDAQAYARLFANVVVPEISLEELDSFMPDTMVEMENTLAEGIHNFSVSQAPEPVYAPPSGDSGFVSFTVSMPTEAWLVYERTKSAVAKVLAADHTPLNADPALAHGQVLELLSVDAAMGGMGGLLE